MHVQKVNSIESYRSYNQHNQVTVVIPWYIVVYINFTVLWCYGAEMTEEQKKAAINKYIV